MKRFNDSDDMELIDLQQVCEMPSEELELILCAILSKGSAS